MSDTVIDWATDYDIFGADYVADPYPIWEDLRQRCPIAHSDRFGGSWLPTRYADVTAIARDVEHFQLPATSPWSPGKAARPCFRPVCHRSRPTRLCTPGRGGCSCRGSPTTGWRATNRQLVSCVTVCSRASHLGKAMPPWAMPSRYPVRVIGMILGVPEAMADTFTGWVRSGLEFAYDTERKNRARDELVTYFLAEIDARRDNPGSDLISVLLHTEVDGEPVPDAHILGTVALTLIAGVDTTWSAIGSALWHLATHDDDRRRLADDPSLIPTAVEELLRAYSPVTMARIVTSDTTVDGCPMQAGDRVLLSFAAANRDRGGLRRPGPGCHRPPGQPTRCLRCRHPPLCRLESCSHGAAASRSRNGSPAIPNSNSIRVQRSPGPAARSEDRAASRWSPDDDARADAELHPSVSPDHGELAHKAHEFAVPRDTARGLDVRRECRMAPGRRREGVGVRSHQRRTAGGVRRPGLQLPRDLRDRRGTGLGVRRDRHNAVGQRARDDAPVVGWDARPQAHLPLPSL